MISAGFADPVQDSQRCFRAVLEAMSRPGRIHRLPALAEPPAPLHSATAAVLLTLADADTPVWLDRAEPLDWLRFHCGCPVLTEAGAARFVVAVGAMPALASLALGTEEEPHLAATLLVQVQGLRAGQGWRLTGPGIEREHRLAVDGLPADFLAQWSANRARFPQGVDIVLCAGDSLACLPRTVAIEEAG
jgi:alpha-D-ribose 1-methylphosphonate 5-triphosphate synthase subunit PhnH